MSIVGGEFVKEIGTGQQVWSVQVRRLVPFRHILKSIASGRLKLFEVVRQEVFGDCTCWSWSSNGASLGTFDCGRMYSLWNFRRAIDGGLK